MFHYKKADLWLWVFFLVLLIGLFGGLHIMDLRGEEPRRGLITWEMIHQSNFLRPSIQGMAYYNKPPIFNWVLAVFFAIFGDANWVVRIPSILGLLGMGAFHYIFTKHYVDKQTALWSLLFLLSGGHILFFATVLSGELDLFYALFVYLQAIFIFHFFQKKQWLALFLTSYLMLSLGFLTKGLPSIAFQGLTLLGIAFYYRQWRWLFSWQHILGGLLGVLPIALYFWIYDQYYGQGLAYVFNLLEEASQKSASESRLTEILSQLFEFPSQYLLDYLPWSLLLLFFFRKESRQQIKEHPFLVFCLLFFVANIWIYWISPGARSRYLYPFAPFFITPLVYMWLKAGFPKVKIAIGVVLFLVFGRVVYNYTVMPYQQRTMSNIQLYRQITEDALEASEGQAIATCCIKDSIFVNPSLGELTLLRDTLYLPMYLPYQIPFYIQRDRDQILPFHEQLQPATYYLSTDTLVGEALKSYPVWDDKTLYLFKTGVPE